MPIDEKPSRNEDEYFLKQDAELIKARRERLDAEREARERTQQSPKCPRDGSALEEQEFHKVKIDRCPTCGGVWLDGGELEQLTHVERGGFGRVFGDLIGRRHP